MSVNGWLYLIQRGDHRKQHEEIYKIGRPNDFTRRINEYPPYSQVITVCHVDNDNKSVRGLITEFKSEFELRNDIGNESFEGDERDMILFLMIMSQNIYLIEKKMFIWFIIGKLKIKG
jgi:hypothetical protein